MQAWTCQSGGGEDCTTLHYCSEGTSWWLLRSLHQAGGTTLGRAYSRTWLYSMRRMPRPLWRGHHLPPPCLCQIRRGMYCHNHKPHLIIKNNRVWIFTALMMVAVQIISKKLKIQFAIYIFNLYAFTCYLYTLYMFPSRLFTIIPRLLKITVRTDGLEHFSKQWCYGDRILYRLVCHIACTNLMYFVTHANDAVVASYSAPQEFVLSKKKNIVLKSNYTSIPN